MKKSKNITYLDIAKETKLGIGTISRYFNNGSISKKSKQKIEKFIKEKKYSPNIGAQLIKGYENCVYLIICSTNEKSIIDIIESIVNNFKKININVYIVVSSYDYNEYLDSLKKTINRKPKTLILLSPIMNQKLLDYINNIKINTFIYGNNITNKPSLILDEEFFISSLTDKIIEDNIYKKIIYIGKSLKDPTTGKKRYDGFLKSVKNNKFKNYKSFFVNENIISNDFELSLNDLFKEDLDNTILICGTHTIFTYLYFQKIKNNFKFDLTDIGYVSQFDYLKETYKYKIFIDFYKVGLLLYDFSFKKTNKNIVFNDLTINKK